MIPAILLFIFHISFNTVDEGYAINPGCTCITYISTYGKERGTFHSPDYPKQYPNNIDCLLFAFRAAPYEIVEIIFTDFDVYKGFLDCTRGDYLKVYTDLLHGTELSTNPNDGLNEYSEWTRVLCGSRSEIPAPIYSAGPVMFLEFHTGAQSSNSSGFVGTFKFLDRRLFETDGVKVESTECDHMFESVSSRTLHGRLFSPRYPSNYPNNIRCVYKFHGRANERVRVLFEEVSLQKGDQSCLNREDIIKVFDGGSSQSPSIALLCNELTDIEILSKGPDLYIEFTSNSDMTGQGFKASYQFQPKEDGKTDADVNMKIYQKGFSINGPEVSATTATCHQVFSSDIVKNGTMISLGYPKSYPPKTHCHYDFSGRGKERVRIFFQDFDLYKPSTDITECDNFDSLQAFVYVDGRLEKINSFCGSTLPKPIMSNGPKLVLEFRGAESSRLSRGFKINYAFVEDFGLKTGKQLLEFPCAFVFNSTESKNGTFTSPNFPGLYPRDTECNYFFYGEPKERVHIFFTYFDVEGVLPCELTSASDYVEFSNFVIEDKKYRRHCGQLEEFHIKSDRKFFKVTFKSNNRLDGNGFRAVYQFLHESLEYELKSSSRSSYSNHNSTSSSKQIILALLFFIYLKYYYTREIMC